MFFAFLVVIVVFAFAVVVMVIIFCCCRGFCIIVTCKYSEFSVVIYDVYWNHFRVKPTTGSGATWVCCSWVLLLLISAQGRPSASWRLAFCWHLVDLDLSHTLKYLFQQCFLRLSPDSLLCESGWESIYAPFIANDGRHAKRLKLVF